MTQDGDDLRFRDLALHPALLRAVEELGYEQPTPIQAGAIPPLLEGSDLLGQAQTGTGKTAAFALPLLQRLDIGDRSVQAIVLTPTRELALQVAEAVRSYGKHLGTGGVAVLPIYGGQPIHVQRNALRTGVHVVIGTPGRVRDHLERGTLSLDGVRFFGLDEADEMLKMGFIDDVEWILEHAPQERQIALFSATLPAPIRRVAKRHLRDAVDMKIAQRTLTVAGTEQYAMRVERHERVEALERVLEAEDYEAVLIFAGTQNGTAQLAEHLQGHGYQAECIHGGMDQKQREAVVERLKKGSTRVVVATDVAARGLDVDHIGLVVNFDVPRDPQTYVHRIGRTGRAGRSGRAITLWQPRDRHMMRAIERASGQAMTAMRIPGRAEIVDRRRERMQDKLRAAIGGEIEPFRNLVREMEREEALDPVDLAAAAFRVAWGESPLYGAPEPEPAAKGRPDDDELVEIVLPVGSWNRVRPGAIVGAIAGETGLPGTVVGRIKILEKVTFVAVPGEHVSRIMGALKGVRIAGRVIYPRLAHDPE